MAVQIMQSLNQLLGNALDNILRQLAVVGEDFKELACTAFALAESRTRSISFPVRDCTF